MVTVTLEETESINDADKQLLREKLQAIEAACASFNKKAAKTALADLKEKTWPRPVRDKLSAIGEYLLHSEFEAVAAIAREMYAG